VYTQIHGASVRYPLTPDGGIEHNIATPQGWLLSSDRRTVYTNMTLSPYVASTLYYREVDRTFSAVDADEQRKHGVVEHVVNVEMGGPNHWTRDSARVRDYAHAMLAQILDRHWAAEREAQQPPVGTRAIKVRRRNG
jgi:hypothetical protein